MSATGLHRWKPTTSGFVRICLGCDAVWICYRDRDDRHRQIKRGVRGGCNRCRVRPTPRLVYLP